MKERILCAALMYNGKLVAGYRHHDCYQSIADLLGVSIDSIPDAPGREHQGFLTSNDRFVDRYEGYRIAREMNQLRMPHVDGCMEMLISEDLY